MKLTVGILCEMRLGFNHSSHSHKLVMYPKTWRTLSVSTNENYRIHQKIKIHVLAPNFSLFLSQPTFMLSRMKLKTSVTIPQNNWFKIHMNLSGSMKYPTPPSLFQCKEVMSPTPSPCNNISFSWKSGTWLTSKWWIWVSQPHSPVAVLNQEKNMV